MMNDNNGFDVVDLTVGEEDTTNSTNWWESTISWIWAPVAAVLGIAAGATVGVLATSAHYKKLADEREQPAQPAQPEAEAAQA